MRKQFITVLCICLMAVLLCGYAVATGSSRNTVGLTSEMTLGSGTFMYTEAGGESPSRRDLTDVYILTVEITDTNKVVSGIFNLRYDPEIMTYEGFDIGSDVELCKVNEPTLSTGTVGSVKFAFANTVETDMSGSLFSCAFSRNDGITDGTETVVDIECEELFGMSESAIEYNISGTTYTFTEVPESEDPTEPVSDTPTEPVSDTPTEPVSDTPTEPVSEAPTAPVSEIPSATIGLLGDVNGDEKVNTADAVVILRHAAGMISLTPEQLRVADSNRDGSINTADAVTILRLAAGLISEL